MKMQLTWQAEKLVLLWVQLCSLIIVIGSVRLAVQELGIN